MDDAKVSAGVGGEWKVFLYANRTCFCFLEVGIVRREKSWGIRDVYWVDVEMDDTKNL